ncbi:hypothetical protein D5S19_29750 [Amycolatopsis panacis]|uniref:Uncharacterized protein n=1 Tax=Amycolatopsis panacis TaxID=2340917 RepID=A0A419HLT7_9PSEU|nr:hypothetical protein D5S19_29750 [Amycolatopsis panacis]
MTALAFGDPPLIGARLLSGDVPGTPPRQRLLTAIVLGARGRYAAATTLLDRLRREPDPVVASFAGSTLASHRRQLGGHAAARKLDGAALLLVGAGAYGAQPDSGPGHPTGDPKGAVRHPADPDSAGLPTAVTDAADPASADPGGARTGATPVDRSAAVGTNRASFEPDGLDVAGARADALLGLAADNLALGRLGAARRLAVRAAQADRRWRAAVRGGWVAAEIELADGQHANAVAPARRALEIARVRGARRHAVKSAIVLGVALTAAGEEGALELLGVALEEAEKYELHSLTWVAAQVTADLDTGHAERYRFRSREVLHAVLRQADPCVMRIARESPWVPAGAG